MEADLQDGRGEGLSRIGGALPSPLRGGVGGPAEDHRTTPTPPASLRSAVDPPHKGEGKKDYAAMLATTCASSCSRRAGERRPFSVAENFSSAPFSNAATTLWCT